MENTNIGSPFQEARVSILEQIPLPNSSFTSSISHLAPGLETGLLDKNFAIKR